MMAALKRIGTHDGMFHCDEVLACYMLKKLPEYVTAQIVRSRQQAILDTCDIVVDVGGEYNPSSHRYDHHQKTFSLSMNALNPSAPWKIKLSSAGLVYHHFGRRILEVVTGASDNPEQISNLYNYIYQNFVQEIDGIDNGVPMFDGEPKYRIHTNLSSRVSHLNPAWNNTDSENGLTLFNKAMELVGAEFEDRVNYFMKSWWPAKKLVLDAVANRFNVDSSGEVIELSVSCPWKEHLCQIEMDQDLGQAIKYVIFTDSSNNWRVQAVPVDPSSFVLRVPLLAKWMGLRDAELSDISGIKDCIFVHANGFIGGNKTRNGALQMAVDSLKLQSDSVRS